MTKSALIILAILSLTTSCSPKLSQKKRLEITQQYIFSSYERRKISQSKVYVNPKLVYRRTLMGHKIPFSSFEPKSFTLGFSNKEINCWINDKAIFDTLLLTIPEEYQDVFSYYDNDDYSFLTKLGVVFFYSPAFRTNKKNIYGIQSYSFAFQRDTLDVTRPTDIEPKFIQEGMLYFGVFYNEFTIVNDSVKFISPIYNCDGTVWDNWKYNNIFTVVPPTYITPDSTPPH